MQHDVQELCRVVSISFLIFTKKDCAIMVIDSVAPKKNYIVIGQLCFRRTVCVCNCATDWRLCIQIHNLDFQGKLSLCVCKD